MNTRIPASRIRRNDWLVTDARRNVVRTVLEIEKDEDTVTVTHRPAGTDNIDSDDIKVQTFGRETRVTVDR